MSYCIHNSYITSPRLYFLCYHLFLLVLPFSKYFPDHFFALLLLHQLFPSTFYNIFQFSVLNVILCNEEHFSLMKYLPKLLCACNFTHFGDFHKLLSLSFISLSKRICSRSKLVSYNAQLEMCSFFGSEPLLIIYCTRHILI